VCEWMDIAVRPEYELWLVSYISRVPTCWIGPGGAEGVVPGVTMYLPGVGCELIP
jgi:hypothetical protein